MFATVSDIERFNHIHDSDFKDIPLYKMKITRFLNNTVTYAVSKTNFKGFNKPASTGFYTTYAKTMTEEELQQKKIENIERSARRAKQAVHHLVRQIGADHMLTLSTRENITDLKQFDEIFKRFIRLVREKMYLSGRLIPRLEHQNWAYVAVREYQERGALHMHIACVGRQDIPTLRACWYVALGGSCDDTGDDVRGQVDVQSHTKRFSGKTDVYKTFKLVNYLTKYISKTFETDSELGQRRYKSSRHIPKPTVTKQYLQAYFSYGDKPFIDAMKHALIAADLEGVKDMQLWNRGQDIFIINGNID